MTANPQGPPDGDRFATFVGGFEESDGCDGQGGVNST